MAKARSKHDEGQAWQLDVWDGMTPVYELEVDRRFVPVVDQLMLRAEYRTPVLPERTPAESCLPSRYG